MGNKNLKIKNLNKEKKMGLWKEILFGKTHTVTHIISKEKMNKIMLFIKLVMEDEI